MNKKAFYTIALFIITLASCCKVDVIEVPGMEEEQVAANLATRVEDGSEYAFVRIGMYENVDNHDVIITNINIILYFFTYFTRIIFIPFTFRRRNLFFYF